MSELSDYLANLTPAQKQQFERTQGIVKKLVPDAEEVISYGIPTWKHKGKYVLYFAVNKNHMSLHPAISDLGPEIEAKMQKYRYGKGTLRFTKDDPVPEEVIEAMVRHRLEVIDGRSSRR